MAEQAKTQDQPQTASGITLEQLNSTLTAAIASAVKPLTDKLGELEKNQGIMADTLTKLPPATADAGKGDAKATPLTAEAVAKIAADAIAADRKQQAEADAKSQAKKDARAKVVKDKLNGDEELGSFLPDTDNADQLAAAADKLVSKATPKAKLPGTASDGGKPPAKGPIDYSKLNASQKVQIGIDQMLGKAAAT